MTPSGSLTAESYQMPLARDLRCQPVAPSRGGLDRLNVILEHEVMQRVRCSLKKGEAVSAFRA
jgi:hypothetical protein